MRCIHLFQKIFHSPVTGPGQPRIQRHKGGIKRPSCKPVHLSLIVYRHIVVPRPVFPFPVPPVQITGMINPLSLRFHCPGHALVCGTKRPNLQFSNLIISPGFHLMNPVLSFIRAEPDISGQHILRLRTAVPKPKDLFLKMIRMCMAVQKINPAVCRRLWQLPVSIVIKYQHMPFQLHAKTAVAYKCNLHNGSFLFISEHKLP